MRGPPNVYAPLNPSDRAIWRLKADGSPIALELLRRVQVDRCGACAVADGEWCGALNVAASRVSRSQRVRRGPEQPPVLRPPKAPAPTIVRNLMQLRVQVGKAPFVARRPHSFPPSSFGPSAGPAHKAKTFLRERRMNGGAGAHTFPICGHLTWSPSITTRGVVEWPTPLRLRRERFFGGANQIVREGGRLRRQDLEGSPLVCRGRSSRAASYGD